MKMFRQKSLQFVISFNKILISLPAFFNLSYFHLLTKCAQTRIYITGMSKLQKWSQLLLLKILPKNLIRIDIPQTQRVVACEIIDRFS